MKVGNKISVKTMQLLRKYFRRSECNRTKTKPSEYHWSNDVHKFKCIRYTDRVKQSANHTEHPL